jgi:hypothetical protein
MTRAQRPPRNSWKGERRTSVRLALLGKPVGVHRIVIIKDGEFVRPTVGRRPR